MTKDDNPQIDLKALDEAVINLYKNSKQVPNKQLEQLIRKVIDDAAEN